MQLKGTTNNVSNIFIWVSTSGFGTFHTVEEGQIKNKCVLGNGSENLRFGRHTYFS